MSGAGRSRRRLLGELAAIAAVLAVAAVIVIARSEPLEARRVAREYLLGSRELRERLGEDVRTAPSLADFLIRVETGVTTESRQRFRLVGARGEAAAHVWLCRPLREGPWRVRRARVEQPGGVVELEGGPC
jgi:hypothetical protein